MSSHDLAIYSEKKKKHDNEIYVCNELYQSFLTNPDLISKTKEQFGNSLHYIADSAEQDRIEEFRMAGFFIEPCSKGSGSVKHGIDFLKSKKIHIHKTNCPNTAQEIKKYKWREDKQGNVLDEPVKFKDHAMDAMRYGTEPWRLRSNEPVVVDVVKNFEYGRDGVY